MKNRMYALALSSACLALASLPAVAEGVKAGKYELDSRHASVTFSVDHLGFSYYTGRFNTIKGELNLVPDAVEKSTFLITIDPASVDTNDKVLEGKLKKPDVFNTEKFRTIVFRSTGVKQKDAKHATITGNVEWMGKTVPLSLETTLNGYGPHPFGGKEMVGFSATGSLKRSDFGINAYLPAVGDEVQLRVEAEFAQKKPTDKKR
jgi:polyisoprenoid-binding protein YceI